MEQTNKLTGFKKRQQIEQANKTIFLWVAAASVVVSISLVLLQFLVRAAIFNQQIIDAKSTTNRTLEENIKNADVLKQNIDNLLADKNLASVRTETSNNNLKVILDALPATGDSATFANSLQNAILDKSGATVTGLTAGTTDAVSLIDSTTSTAVVDATPQTIPFTASLSGDFRQIRTALLDIERVIRPMDIATLIVQGKDAKLTLSITGFTYFQPEKTIKIGTKTIKPGTGATTR